jgi:hypothetical protein
MARRIAKEETEEVVKTQGVQETQETESSTETQQEQETEQKPETQEPNPDVEKQEDKPKTETKKGDKIPENVEALMKLYPHMKEMIVNSKGFLFTPGTPQSMHNDGILYKNKFFNNN